MRVLLINSVCGIGSTGRICGTIAEDYERDGHEVKIAYGRDSLVPERYQRFGVRIGTDWDVKLHAVATRLLDKHGFSSKKATRKFLEWAEAYNPDVLWMHNIHGYYINVEMLFQWVKSRPNMKVQWTLHDCWAFTGHCVHFVNVGCSKWKSYCEHCPMTRDYPESKWADNSRQNFERKRNAFTGVKDMTLIVPSQWLADLVGQSFLKEYPIEVRHNTVDKTVFKPTDGDFRIRYGLENQKIVLGVASTWDARKGLDTFVQLARRLGDQYTVVLVGLSEKQIQMLPQGMVGVRRTNSPRELAEIYTAADVFVNPSREETFGLTTIEARACGTEAIVYKGTACEEVVNTYGGVAVEPGLEQIMSAIQRILD